jgi:DNA-directed RNA polymerase subunit RPC12/RpoP
MDNKHKYVETRSIHYYKCGNCNETIEEVDGNPAYCEEIGPAEHELECTKCGAERDVEYESEINNDRY